jgi:hypothetical protein
MPAHSTPPSKANGCPTLGSLTVTSKPNDTKPPTPPLPGRGGPEHKYLQSLLKRIAEDRGYRANVEMRVLDGLGHVDLALIRGETRIACEISITTDPRHEVGNLQKCLAAGFEHVIAVSSQRKTLRAIRSEAEGTLSETDAARVRFLTPEEFTVFLEAVDAESASRTETIQGYKVNVKFEPVSSEERSSKSDLLKGIVARSIRRLRKGDS